MAVLEVTGFQFLKEKVARTIATLDDLENPDNQIKIRARLLIYIHHHPPPGSGPKIICHWTTTLSTRNLPTGNLYLKFHHISPILLQHQLR